MRRSIIAPFLLAAVAISACSGGAGSSVAPSTGASAAPSASPSSAAPSAAASASPSAAASASAAASGAASPAASGARVDVVGTDYAFAGLEASYTGPVTMAFRNEGAEVHELVVVRKNPDVTESWDALLALPQEESATKVAFVGATFAEPGQTAPDMLTADQPGDYLAVCFIPQGTTDLPSLDPNASEPPDLGTGAPHFTLGMRSEFTISQ